MVVALLRPLVHLQTGHGQPLACPGVALLSSLLENEKADPDADEESEDSGGDGATDYCARCVALFGRGCVRG